MNREKTDPSTDTQSPFSDETVVWEKLSNLIEAFSEAWEKESTAPELEKFVPNEDDLNFRRMALTELIKVDLEYRCEPDQELYGLDHYFAKWPFLISNGLPPLDLIYEEYQIRQRMGEAVSVQKYADAYPECKEALGRLLGQSLNATTSVFSSMKTREYELGDQVDDFQIISKLGQGAFAIVYLARQISMQRLVALKVSADKGIEHQMLAQLDHPNIVRVYDVRKMEDTGARLMYMQYVSGGTLQDAFKFVKSVDEVGQTGERFLEAIDQALVARGELPPQDSENRKKLAGMDWPRVVSQLGSQLAAALEFAHKQNVLHRDLKPANVLVAANGSPKLVDFNISHSSKIDGVSPAAYFGGSLAYMSPEQLEAFNPSHDRQPDELDERSDIYSLGCLLFELLTGQKPFVSPPQTGDWQAMLNTMIKQRHRGLPPEAREQMKNAPRMLSGAIERCLQPHPADRFDSAQPLSRQLNWATDPEIERAALPSNDPLTRILRRFPTVIVMAISVTISGLAAIFISNYNVEESVPEASLELFRKVRDRINLIAFPCAMIGYIWITRIVSRNVRRSMDRERIPGQEVKLAIERNLIVGHWGSAICAALWITAGILYPLILYLLGVEMTSKGWIDFIGSHLLAGLITSAYSFFAATYCALKYWQPILYLNFLRLKEVPDVRPALDRLRRIVGIYQFVAVMIPMLSIALLVLWGGADNKIALITVSVASVLGVGFLFWAARQIMDRINITERMSRKTSA